MSFSSLPSEIIYKIITEISLASLSSDGNASTQALGALSRCSHRMHVLVEPLLYSSFVELTERSLFVFLRTIFESPRLAQLVETYEGRDTRAYRGQATLKFPSSYYASQQERNEMGFMLFQSIQRGDINDEGTLLWLDAILENSWDAATALAITCLPNLKMLTFSVADRILTRDAAYGPELYEIEPPFAILSFRWINGVFRDAQKLQSGGGTESEGSMRRLETIKLTVRGNISRGTLISDMIGFLCLKSLKTFRCHNIWLADDTEDGLVTFSVPNITLNNSMAQFGYSPSVFRLFQQVECFEFIVAPKVDFLAGGLVSSLSHLQKSLHTLVIRGCESGNVSPRGRYDIRPSLTAFEFLETLDIMAPHLIDWTEAKSDPARRISWDLALPTNIKDLRIRRCVQSTVVDASNLVYRKENGSCKLQTLHLGFMWDFPQEAALTDVNALKEQCLRARVVFTVDWRLERLL